MTYPSRGIGVGPSHANNLNLKNRLRRANGPGDDRLHGGACPSFGERRQRGERAQAIGPSRGGRTTKIHALSVPLGRPLAFLLTGGQVADCTAADRLLDRMPATDLPHGDKGYDSTSVRRKIEEAGAAPNIPPRANKRLEKLLLSIPLSES